VIRRLFWLTLGAVMGVAGYRKVTTLARSISPVYRARELTRFAGDVREGMELYMERQPGQAPPTLRGHQVRPTLTDHRSPEHRSPDHGSPDHREDGR
jgi:hypothetical protein